MEISSAIEGTWHLTMRTPLGTMNADMTFVDTPEGLTGTATGKDETVPLTDLTMEPAPEGHHVVWKQQITRPMRLDLSFDVLVNGDKLTGTSRAGRLPRSKVTGTRQPKPA
jgi:hypothetical protein